MCTRSFNVINVFISLFRMVTEKFSNKINIPRSSHDQSPSPIAKDVTKMLPLAHLRVLPRLTVVLSVVASPLLLVAVFDGV
jgi:hypothetical protein